MDGFADRLQSTPARAPRRAPPLQWLLAGAILLPLLVAAAGAWLTWRTVWRAAETELVHTTDAAAEYARRLLDGHRAAADRVNDLLRGLPDDEIRSRENELHAALRAMVPNLPQVQTAYVTDRRGQLLLSASVHPVPPADMSDREYHTLYQRPEPPATVVTRSYRGRVEPHLFFAVSRPRRGTGNGLPADMFDGQANVSVNPGEVSAGLRRLVGQPDDSLSLFRDDGQVLARHPTFADPLPPLARDGPIMQAVARADRGVLHAPSPTGGQARLIAFRAIEGWPGLHVGTGRDHARIVAVWQREAMTHLAFALPAMLALAALGLMVQRGQTRLAEANTLLELRVTDRTTALRRSEARLRLATEGAGVGTWEMDLHTGQGVRSLEAMGIQGATTTHFSTGDSLTQVHPDDRPLVAAAQAEALRSGDYAVVFRTLGPAADGGPRWVLARGRVEFDATGTPARAAGVMLDVTAQRRAELALAQSEARLRLATEAAGVGVWETDLHTGRGHRSALGMAMMGAERADYTWDESVALIHPDDRADVRAALERANATGQYEAVFRTAHPAPDGQPRWLMARGSVELDTDGTPRHSAGVLVDVTAERRADAARRESEARFRAFQDVSPVGFAIYRAVRDAAGAVQDLEVEYANPAAHRIVGAPPGTLVGGRLLRQLPEARDAPMLLPRYLRILAGAEPGGEVQIEMRRPRFHGWFRNAVVRLDTDRLALSLQDMTAEHDARDTLARSHAELEALVEARTAALLRAADEKRRAEEMARQSEKLAALGQLVGGVAHDFNNLLQVIGSGAALLRRPGLTEPRRAAVLEGMERAGDTARELTGRLLAFARQQPLSPETFSLNARLLGMSAMLRQTLGSTVRVETDLAPDLWPVHADPGQLELAVLNLAVNARDAMPEGGRLVLSTRNETLPASADHFAGDYVCLDVRDTGIGMAPAVMARALEPFFTTKEPGRGTGLGLPQVFGFARQSGGDLRVDSTPGAGTTVTIVLPRAAGTPDASAATAAGTLRMPKFKAVLVVEDNVAAGEFAASLLEELGYRAHTATSATHAMDLLRAGEVVDAVFSDVVLPGGMSGNELAVAIARQFPHIAVVLATGYGGQAAATSPPPGVETLPKPYQLAELAAALERALSRVERPRLAPA
jgi:PAS domain S-box-containing protein